MEILKLYKELANQADINVNKKIPFEDRFINLVSDLVGERMVDNIDLAYEMAKVFTSL